VEASGRRELMVDRQIAARGVRDHRVLAAMREVPRERFIERELDEHAYEDAPLGIGGGQTISQPYVVALMCEALGLVGTEKVLEVGTGSGYGAAVLGKLARDVYTIERRPELAALAAGRLAALGYSNVHVVEGDGSLGLPEQEPFEAIVVTAGSPRVPRPLLQQLATGGCLVIPVGASEQQRLLRIDRTTPDHYQEQDLGPVSFVPLLGAEGWRG
jgi:protein-L-isoaspartate(D-aspartate) O-methyltransferase